MGFLMVTTTLEYPDLSVRSGYCTLLERRNWVHSLSSSVLRSSAKVGGKWPLFTLLFSLFWPQNGNEFNEDE
jgi:hypothetical protein